MFVLYLTREGVAEPSLCVVKVVELTFGSLILFSSLDLRLKNFLGYGLISDMLTCGCDCIWLQSYLIHTIRVKCFQAKLLAVQKELGHEIRVFTNTTASEKPDDVSASATGFYL